MEYIHGASRVLSARLQKTGTFSQKQRFYGGSTLSAGGSKQPAG